MTLCGWCKRNRANNNKNYNNTSVSSSTQSSMGCCLRVNMDAAQVDDMTNKCNPRNKCALKPGHSLMDWIRLGSSGYDLAGTKGKITPVSHVELAAHCTINDAWLAIRDKVYNVTKYMDFHPGGSDELMKGVGKDATKMFDEVHAWVNYEQLLSKCYVGPLRNSATITLDMDNKKSSNITTNGNFKAPLLPPTVPSNQIVSNNSTNNTENATQNSNAKVEQPSTEIVPRFDWIQKTANLTCIFYTKSMCNPGLNIEQQSDIEVIVRIFIDQTMHFCNLKFLHAVQWPCGIKLSNETGKIELVFTKSEPALWTSFGTLDRRKITELDSLRFEYTIETRVQTSHDSYAILLMPKQNILHCFPIGYHVSVTATVNNSEITRSFTPVPIAYLPTPCSNNQQPSAFCVPLLVKSYTSGLLSTYLCTSELSTTSLQISQPKGNFKLHKIRSHSRIAILAAGSGVTPMLSILDYLLQRTHNKIEAITFIYFNKTQNDIWCQQYLEQLCKKDDRINLIYILSEPSVTWTSKRGRVSSEIIETLVDKSSANFSTFCCVCGPAPFSDLCLEYLKCKGFPLNHLHIFQG